MKEGFIQNTLEDLLKVRFRVKYLDDVIEEELRLEEKKSFCKLLSSMEKLQENEVKIYEEFGLSISTIVEPYWDLIEDMIDFMYLPEAADVIWFYIHERKDTSGRIYEWSDGGKTYKFKTPEDLFEYIRYTYETNER